MEAASQRQLVDRNSWDYVLSLERDLVRTLDFVELTEDNCAAYSNEYAKLLLLAGSEADTVMRALASKLAGKTISGIKAYQKVIVQRYDRIFEAEIRIPRTGAVIRPLEAWKKSRTVPDWWQAYNELKHDRVTNFRTANQANVVRAISGLLVINVYFYEGHLEPYTQLLDCGYPDHIVTSGNFKMPGL